MRKKIIELLKKHGILIKDTGKKYYFDYSLLFAVVFLILFGLLMIYSASSYSLLANGRDPERFVIQQGKFAIAGFIVMIVVSYLDYHWILKVAKHYYIGALFLNILTSIIGKEFNGQRRWLSIGSITVQSSEFAKSAIIIMLALLLSNMGDRKDDKRAYFWIVVVLAPVLGIVFTSGLSATIIIYFIAFIMCFVNTRHMKLYAVLSALPIVLLIVSYFVVNYIDYIPFLKAYQVKRFATWVNPEQYAKEGGRQVLAAIYGIGSGGFFGKGLGESIQKRSALSEAGNDMIFAVICEELGFVGAAIVMFLYGFLLYRLYKLAENSPDRYGFMLIVGVFAHIAIQVVLNICVVTNTIPNTGITLPFISYGGTAILTTMGEIGIVLGVARQIKKE